MKKTIVTLISGLAIFSARADEAYALVNDPQGYSYIQINQNLDSFTFVSDFKSIGGGGTVGFFIYPDGLTGNALKEYIATVPHGEAEFGKKMSNGVVDLGALKAGDRVGFFEDKNGHGIVRGWDFQTDHKGQTYIAFDKNNGSGKDEWMSIGEITATVASEGGTGGGNSGNGGAPSGQPLPGALAMLALGGTGLGIFKLKNKKAKKA